MNWCAGGTAYQLAVSGMHIAVVGGIVLLLCRLLCCPPRLATLLALGVVLLYGLSVRPAPPVIRAVILCQGFGLSLLLRRGCDKLQWLSLAALAVLLWQPLGPLHRRVSTQLRHRFRHGHFCPAGDGFCQRRI